MIFKWWLQNGETCLHAAATSGNPKLVKLLLEHGADPALCNDGGQTALDLLMMFVNYGNITLTPNLLKVCLPKVEVTFYLRLRNEFQIFLAKNQASDWLTQQVNQLEAWFLAGNYPNSFLNLRYKVSTIFVDSNRMKCHKKST